MRSSNILGLFDLLSCKISVYILCAHFNLYLCMLHKENKNISYRMEEIYILYPIAMENVKFAFFVFQRHVARCRESGIQDSMSRISLSELYS